MVHPARLRAGTRSSGGIMQNEDDTRLGSPPEARRSTDDKPPRTALRLMVGLILGCAVIVAIVLWFIGEVPGSR